jgi:spermidine synthase
MVLNQSIFAFGAVLLTVLVSLALGAELVARLARRDLVDPHTLLGAALAATALGLALFPALLEWATGGLRFVGSERPWPAYLVSAVWTTVASAGPALLCAGLVFPLTFALAAGNPVLGRGGAGAPLGRLVAANTVGALLGALAAPYALLPAAGPWASFAWIAVLFAVPGFFVADVTRTRHAVRAAVLAGAVLAVFVTASPLQRSAVKLARGESLIAAFGSASGVVAVIERGGERLIRTDDHYVLGGTGEQVHEERQAHLPLLLHPRPRRVAFVGSATGISAGAALLHPIERLSVVELIPDVVRAARDFFRRANRGVYDDPRSDVVLDDARNFLRFTHSRFDVVIADLFVPWRSGTGALYTREHFEAVKRRLEPGGLFCQWLPLYQLSRSEFDSIAATFLDVFPRSGLYRGDFFGAYPIVALIGFEGRAAPARLVEAAAQRLGTRGVGDRWVTDPAGVFALYVGPLDAAAPWLAGVARNTDDRPRIQYLAARTHLGGERGKPNAFVGLDWARFATRSSRAESGRDGLHPDLTASARRSRAGGAALQLAGAYWVEGRREDSARALELASELLAPQLLRNAPADPTAAEVWPAEE